MIPVVFINEYNVLRWETEEALSPFFGGKSIFFAVYALLTNLHTVRKAVPLTKMRVFYVCCCCLSKSTSISRCVSLLELVLVIVTEEQG